MNSGANRRSTLRWAFGFLVVLGVAGACRPKSTGGVAKQGESPGGDAPASLPESKAGPTLAEATDSLGRSIKLSAVPRRIVSLAPAHTETLFAIGAGRQVVAVTTYDDYPPEVKSLPKIGGFDSATASVELIVAAKPDLVVGMGKHHAALINLLDAHRIPAVALDAPSIAAIHENIRTLGRLTGRAPSADRLIKSITERQTKLQALVEKCRPKSSPSVFYQVWDDPLRTVGGRSYLGQMIDLAGGRNVFAELPDDYPQISAEAIILRNPVVILAASHGDNEVVKAKIMRHPVLQRLSAVRQGQIVLLPEDLVSRPGPRWIDGLEVMVKALHAAACPELFKGSK